MLQLIRYVMVVVTDVTNRVSRVCFVENPRYSTLYVKTSDQYNLRGQSPRHCIPHHSVLLYGNQSNSYFAHLIHGKLIFHLNIPVFLSIPLEKLTRENFRLSRAQVAVAQLEGFIDDTLRGRMRKH
jgi:hypothetical protein